MSLATSLSGCVSAGIPFGTHAHQGPTTPVASALHCILLLASVAARRPARVSAGPYLETQGARDLQLSMTSP